MGKVQRITFLSAKDQTLEPHRWKGQITSSEKESMDHVIQQQKKSLSHEETEYKS